nr:predicted GPI-anchored protein 58 [Malus domestica]
MHRALSSPSPWQAASVTAAAPASSHSRVTAQKQHFRGPAASVEQPNPVASLPRQAILSWPSLLLLAAAFHNPTCSRRSPLPCPACSDQQVRLRAQPAPSSSPFRAQPALAALAAAASLFSDPPAPTSSPSRSPACFIKQPHPVAQPFLPSTCSVTHLPDEQPTHVAQPRPAASASVRTAHSCGQPAPAKAACFLTKPAPTTAYSHCYPAQWLPSSQSRPKTINIRTYHRTGGILPHFSRV